MTDAEVREVPTGGMAEAAPYKAALKTPPEEAARSRKSTEEAPPTPTATPSPPPQPASRTPPPRPEEPPAGDKSPASRQAIQGDALQTRVKELTRPGTLAVMYSVLSVAYMAIGCLLLLVPGLVTRLLFGSGAHPVEAQHTHILRLVGGAGGFAAAGASIALAVDGRGRGVNRASKDAGPTLRLGLATLAALNLLSVVLYPATFTPVAWPAALAFNLAALAPPALQLLSLTKAQDAPSQMQRLAAVRPRSPLAAVLSLLALLYPLAGWCFFLAPKYTLYHLFGYSYGNSTFVLWKMAGAADIALMPAILLALKSAAQAGWMRSPGAMALSAGCAIAGLVHMGVLLPLAAGSPITGWLMPGAVGMWAMSLLASMACLAVGVARARAPTAESKARKGK